MSPKSKQQIKEEMANRIMKKLFQEVEDTKKQIPITRTAGDRLTSSFLEGRLAGLITAFNLIKKEAE